jgi:hypothetical protein
MPYAELWMLDLVRIVGTKKAVSLMDEKQKEFLDRWLDERETDVFGLLTTPTNGNTWPEDGRR